MLPITEHLPLPDRGALRVKDDFLQDVLEGRAYLVFDGAMGTMLQARGLTTDKAPELLCITDPNDITHVHRAYVDAGAQVVTTNTFGANALKLDGQASVDAVFAAAIACARDAGARYVAADIGPTGALLEPLGTLPFDEAYELFAEQARAAQAHGADIVIVETMTDLLEMKAAILAVKEHTDLPLFATMTFEDTGRSVLGTDPDTAATVLAALGVQALGVNCSLGPQALQPLVARMLEVASCPVIVQANAGLPQIVDGTTRYSTGPHEYLDAVRPMLDAGATIVGGCCGTDPRYIELLANEVCSRQPSARTVAPRCCITSAQKLVQLDGSNIAVIGERINPTGKKKLQKALVEGDFDYVVGEAIAQAEAGADVLDVNAGLPEIDEAATLRSLVKHIQGACPLPLQIDSANAHALEAAVRCYPGKPLVNSVNGKREALDAILPIVKHYGCAVVGLTLDEEGIPPTAQGRLEIAKRIVDACEQAGVPRQDVLIDCLVMSAATNQREAGQILQAVSLVKQELGVRTVLGVSNISFGLPARPVVNATFLAAAFASGLDMPILNPCEARYREVVDAWRVLNAQDEAGMGFIEQYAGYEVSQGTKAAPKAQASAQGKAEASLHDSQEGADHALFELVVSGNKGPVPAIVEAMLETSEPLEVVNGHLIPALDEVGRLYESGEFFLPQLMASAEAAKAGFDVLRARLPQSESEGKGPIALATVEGDIHDIGKNIVRMLLENYGYHVIDLGRNVAPQTILDAAIEHDCKIIGLSALMTTTLSGMGDTIALLREQAPHVKVMVGGAVLTQEYADKIGADFYAKDAAESARFAAQVLG